MVNGGAAVDWEFGNALGVEEFVGDGADMHPAIDQGVGDTLGDEVFVGDKAEKCHGWREGCRESASSPFDWQCQEWWRICQSLPDVKLL